MRDNSIFKKLLIYAVVIGVIIAVIVMLVGGMGGDEKTTADLLQMFKDGKVKECVMDNYSDEITVELKDGKSYTFTCTEEFFNDQIYNRYLLDNTGSQEGQIKFDFKEPTTVPWWISMLPTVIILGIVCPIAPVTLGLCLPHARNLGRKKRWYVLTAAGGVWLAMGILLLVLMCTVM